MAKKARQRVEEALEKPFELPEFDIPKFLHHEFEQTRATLVAFGFAVVLGVVSFLLSRLPTYVLVPFGVGFVLLGASPFLIQRIRPRWEEYTRGEWAALIAVEFFGWIGFWFLLADLVH